MTERGDGRLVEFDDTDREKKTRGECLKCKEVSESLVETPLPEGYTLRVKTVRTCSHPLLSRPEPGVSPLLVDGGPSQG